MGTKEICFTHTTVLYAFRYGFGLRKTGQHNVTLPDTYPRRTPHIQGHTIIALRDKIGCLYGFQTVRTTACTYQAVARNDIQRPHTLVVEIGRLKRLVASICQCHGHIIGHGCFRVNGIFGRLIQKVVT